MGKFEMELWHWIMIIGVIAIIGYRLYAGLRQNVIIYGYDIATEKGGSYPLNCDTNAIVPIYYVNQCSLYTSFNQVLPFASAEAIQKYGTDQIILGTITPNTPVAQGSCDFQNTGRIGTNYVYVYCKSLVHVM